MREWTDPAFSSIYYLIKKLEKAGLIRAAESASPAATHPRRATYAPTPEGLAAARQATCAALAGFTPAHPAVLVGLANLPLLTRSEASAALRGRAEELSRELRRLREDPRSRAVTPAFVAAIFDHALTQLRAELAWTHRTIAILEGGIDDEDDGQDRPEG